MNKENYKATIKIVRDSMTRIDPFNLLSGGAPDDEFDSEIISIVGLSKNCVSGLDIAHAIANVLNKSFNENYSYTEFEKEGNLIYKSLQDQKINNKI